jgi:hypothetical protein
VVEGLSHGRGHVIRMGRLDHVGRCACGQGAVDVPRVAVSREDDRAKSGSGRPSLAKYVQAAGFAGQRVDLQREQLRVEPLDQPNRLAAGARLSHHLDPNPIQDDLNRVEPDRVRIQQDRLQRFCG